MDELRRCLAACAGACVLAMPSVHAGVDGGEAAEKGVIVRIAPGAEVRLAQVRNLGELGGAFADAAGEALSIKPAIDFDVADPALAARLGLDRYYRITIPEGLGIEQAIESLGARGDLFESAEREYMGTTASHPTDPYFPIQWNLHHTGQGVQCPSRAVFHGGQPTGHGDIAAMGAWTITTGSAAVVIAVLDSGVSPHVDLGMLRPGWSEDGLSTNDQCSHGTHVAGTIAARANNNVGITGVMWDASILPVRVLRGCGGTDFNYGRGIIWAADRAHIANSSLQYYQVGSFFTTAVRYAYERGLVMVAATGNHAQVVAFPARLPEVIGVGATTYDDEIANFSNRGPQVELSAPGAFIYSLLPRTSQNGISSGWGCMSGTSMASPHVAGVAGLIKTLRPLASPGEVRRIMSSTVEDLGPVGWDQSFGWGRLNAHRALIQTLCYADCDLNGKVDGGDIHCFSTRFADGHPYADLNDDGRFTAEDIAMFMQMLNAGCPD
jgi:subtilisin family serine protease